MDDLCCNQLYKILLFLINQNNVLNIIHYFLSKFKYIYFLVFGIFVQFNGIFLLI